MELVKRFFLNDIMMLVLVLINTGIIFRPIAHFAGYDMPAAPIKTGVTGISTF
jgi:hypothetical protein